MYKYGTPSEHGGQFPQKNYRPPSKDVILYPSGMIFPARTGRALADQLTTFRKGRPHSARRQALDALVRMSISPSSQ